jgi:hypothetical protein
MLGLRRRAQDIMFYSQGSICSFWKGDCRCDDLVASDRKNLLLFSRCFARVHIYEDHKVDNGGDGGFALFACYSARLYICEEAFDKENLSYLLAVIPMYIF